MLKPASHFRILHTPAPNQDATSQGRSHGRRCCSTWTCLEVAARLHNWGVQVCNKSRRMQLDVLKLDRIYKRCGRLGTGPFSQKRMVNSFSDIIIFKNNGFPAFQTLNAKWLFDAGIQLDIPPAVYAKSCTKSVPGITSQNFGAYGETIVFFSKGHLICEEKFLQHLEPRAVRLGMHGMPIHKRNQQVFLSAKPGYISSRLLGMVAGCCMEFLKKGSW